jgi:hypothetical protein
MKELLKGRFAIAVAIQVFWLATSAAQMQTQPSKLDEYCINYMNNRPAEYRDRPLCTPTTNWKIWFSNASTPLTQQFAEADKNNDNFLNLSEISSWAESIPGGAQYRMSTDCAVNEIRANRANQSESMGVFSSEVQDFYNVMLTKCNCLAVKAPTGCCGFRGPSQCCNEKPCGMLEPGVLEWVKPPEKTTEASSVIINNYYTIIVIVMQIKAPYAMSEVTEEVRYKFAMAIASALGINTSNVVLSFRSVDLRRRALLESNGVIVDVSIRGLIDRQSFQSKLSQDALNAQMAKQGLRNVQISSEAKVASQAPTTARASACPPCRPPAGGRLLFAVLLALLPPFTAIATDDGKG